MIDQLFMQDLARDLAPPLEPVEQPATLLAAGPATSDVGQVTVQGYNEAKPSGVRVGRAGISPEQSAKAGGLDRPLVALLDTLAGALKGATAQTLGLPGDIRSILDLISQEGATKYLGEPVMPTTEQMQDILPAVVPQGVANQADREFTAKMASEIGTFLPAPGIPEAAVQGVKAVTKAVKATKGLPVGMSTQAVGEGVDELGFYSAARQAVDAIQQPKGTGDQFLKQIEKTPGVKPDEIKWTGLDDFLKSKKTVTKTEVQEYLDKNKVEIKEVQLADGGLKKKFSINSPEDQDFYDVIDKQGKVIFTGPEDEADYLLDRSLTKFSKYTLPGGENYREVLLTLPSKNPEFDPKDLGRLNDLSNKTRTPAEDVEYKALAQRYDASLRGETSPEFKSSHFDQPNILAHMRVNDRVIDGKKTLFVEEVQSDWHQAGRKKGYKGAMPLEQAKQKMLAEGYSPEAIANSSDADIIKTATEYGVPDAPFKTTWSELAMKRAIQMASEGGYDRIAFTTGKTQAERFDLSKEVNDITVTRNKVDFTIQATDKNGNPSIGKTIPDLRNLDEYVGKDLAEKIKDDFANKSGNEHNYSGLDLQVGGEGMKGFYDDILPKFLNKYSKKWDAKVGKTEIEVGKGKPTSYADFDEYSKAPASSKVEVSYIDITPKMRESTLTKGQPMFAIGAGGAGAAATQQEENK